MIVPWSLPFIDGRYLAEFESILSELPLFI
jgi:hypothetical protein